MRLAFCRLTARLAVLYCALLMVPVAAEVHEVVVGSQQLMFSTQSGMPVRWVSCYPVCESAGAVKVVWFDQSDGFLAWTLSAEPQLAAKLRGSEFAMEQNDTAEFLQLIFRSKQLFNGNYVEFEYRLPKQGYRGELHARGIEGLALTLAPGASMIPEQLPGFGSIYSKVRPFSMDQADFSYLEPPDSGFGAFDMHVASSIGTRSRYWLWLAEPRSQSVGEYGWADINRPIVLVRSSTGSAELILDTYTGPSEFRALQAADPRLTSVLFAAIWNWLRYLSFGLLFLLEWLHGFLGNYGLAIILLSLTVKILMFPLTYVADKWQAQVNATASLLKPKLDEIKRNYKGEEAHNKILAVYKDHNVSQFYTLRSLFGFLIQIPVFIAAFDMLAESFVLGQASFLWISDLAKPDSFAALPFVLPFFGGQLNLLPVVMTALTILSALVQEEADLTPDLMRQQRIKLLLMALAFFLLFYTFPAGMVLYWTANNLFHLLKILPARLRRS